MIFKEIDKTNIIKNKINLEKKVDFVYSSGPEDGFDHANRDILGDHVSGPGIYGSEPVSGIDSKCIKFVDERSLNNVNIGKLQILSRSSEELLSDDEVIKEISIDANISQEDLGGNQSLTYRVSNDKNKNYSFGVNRIKKKYLARDLNAEKIKSVKRLQEYYNNRFSIHNYKRMSWGFSNYNTLNFFTSDVYNSNISTNEYEKTHKNCLLYPNLSVDNKSQYDFSDMSEKTFSFFVNVNKKNKLKKNQSILGINSGCVLFVPGIISVNVIEGSSLDGNGFNEKFRLYIQLGEESYSNIDYTGLNESNNYNSYSSTNNNYIDFVVSKNDIINYNNWHNVCISINNIRSEEYILQIFLDGNLINTFTGNFSFSHSQSENSYITIGNKPTFKNSNYSTNNTYILSKYFSENKALTGFNSDGAGPFCKNFIDFGKNSRSALNITDIAIANHNVLFEDNLFLKDDYAQRNNGFESFAFHGEVHDIRILNTSCDVVIAKEIYENSVRESDQNYSIDELIFYIPVYFVPLLVKKKGIVNLKKEASKIKTENVAYSFPTNPYYFNHVGGHETSVENFVVEFVNQVSPCILFEDSIDGNDYSILEILDSTELKTYSQVGEDPLVGAIKKSKVESSFWTNSAFNKALIYRNNFIFPNDNGIQQQNFNFIFETFFKNELKHRLFEEHSQYYNPSFVFTGDYTSNENLFSTNNSFISENFNQVNNERLENSNSGLYAFINKVQNIENKEVFFSGDSEFKSDVLNSYKIQDSFESRKDKLWNISNRNFHSFYYADMVSEYSGYSSLSDYMTYHQQFNESENFHIETSIRFDARATDSLTEDEKQKLGNKIVYKTSNVTLEVGDTTNKFTTYSNPCSRIYDSNIVLRDSPNKKIAQKSLNIFNDRIEYFSYEMPLYITDYNKENYDTVLFAVSSQLVNKGIKKQTLEILDVDLLGSGGVLSCKLKDNSFGQIYRANCETKVAKWNCIGNILYSEGFININHPGLYNFGYSNFKITFESSTNMYVHELNIPAYSGQFNLSDNKTYIEDLRLNNSSFNLDEDFVYMTDINLHDENLNILAKARLAKPFAKKNSDNVLFRLKMDY